MPYPILEADMRPEPGKIYRLYEDFTDLKVVKDPYIVERKVNEATGETVLIEKKTGEGLMEIEGVFQRSDVRNANKRVYPRSIWERWTRPDSDLMRRIAERQCVGQIEHPKDGVGSLKEAAIVVTGLVLEQDGTVRGRAQVLETPCGEIVRGLARSGVRFGISSRGTGTVNAQGVVDETTFKPETWDIVGNPSTPGAFPKVVEKPAIAEQISESKLTVRTVQRGDKLLWTVLDEAGNVVRLFEAQAPITPNRTTGDSTVNPKDRYNQIQTQVNALLASNITEAAVADLRTTDAALVDLSASAEALVAEDATLRPSVAVLQERIGKRRQEIQSEIDERKTKGKPKVEECGCKHDEDEDEDDDYGESAGGEDDPATLEEALETLMQVRPLLIEQQEQIEQQDQIIESMATDLAEREQTIAELTESLAAANAVIAEMSQSTDPAAESVAEAVESVIEQYPALEESRTYLERCSDAEEVRALAERLVPGSGTRPARGSSYARNDLPPIGGKGNGGSLNEQKKPVAAGRTGNVTTVNENGRTGGGANKSRPAALALRMVESINAKGKKPQING